MSSEKIISNYKEMFLVSACCVLVVLGGQGFLEGIGGRLGMSAALSVLVLVGLKKMVERWGLGAASDLKG